MEQKRPFAALPLLVAATCLVLGFSAQAGQEFYKWKDKNGVTHYSATPPKSETEDTETVRTTNLNPGGDEDDNEEDGQSEESTASNSADSKADGDQPPKDAAACESARKNLDTLGSSPRIRIPDGDSYRYLTPNEIQEQKTANQQIVDLNC
ncbi:DUF4124 domain-containing protein [Pseudomaricurvus sp. HS19]|uniref:DUF4124 domain-containing protein n=1 Tax=Pseudomaricurvus sp. HS19 TaxID=2692626 RepID=UPI001371A785|nr:DUF4124 domain-containing protein [Pseudomaricurvus sp. HS19]MYM64611.1 DUF4124 domain-containing protein [Pseudomaricurvus sp. HS19]